MQRRNRIARQSLRVERSKSEHKVVKKCTECEKQIPVACKTCPFCKLKVTLAKTCRPEDEKDSPSKVRRTERVRRERPDFFNSMEVDKRFKKKRRRKESQVETSSSNGSKASSETSSTAIDMPKKRRGRPKSLSQPDTSEKIQESRTPPEEDFHAHLPHEKILQYQIILSEINRKICTQTFKPV